MVQRWRRRLRRFDRPRDVLDFCGIGLALLCVALPLRLIGVRRTAGRLTPSRVETRAPGVDLAHALRLAEYCDIWLRRLRPTNPCLRRSLVLLALLRRDGLPVSLVIGIRIDRPLHDGDTALAHAWLELDGRPILERTDPLLRHRPSVRYP